MSQGENLSVDESAVNRFILGSKTVITALHKYNSLVSSNTVKTSLRIR